MFWMDLTLNSWYYAFVGNGIFGRCELGFACGTNMSIVPKRSTKHACV